jgi:hypothetical protein
LTTDEGRSTTSPAAICEATSSDSTRMGIEGLLPAFYHTTWPRQRQKHFNDWLICQFDISLSLG